MTSTADKGQAEGLRRLLVQWGKGFCHAAPCKDDTRICGCVAVLMGELSLSLETLAWAASHPAEIKALAEGTMVALSAKELADIVQPYREGADG